MSNHSIRRLSSLAAVLCFLSLNGQAAAPNAATTGSLAPDFTLQDSHGVPVRLSGLRGKVALLDFWATTCGGCKIEIPWYMEFQQKYGAQGLSTIGVATDDDWKIVKPYLQKAPISYPIVIGNEELEKTYRVESLPMTLLIDRDGRIAASHVGMVDRQSFEREIQKLLAR